MDLRPVRTLIYDATEKWQILFENNQLHLGQTRGKPDDMAPKKSKGKAGPAASAAPSGGATPVPGVQGGSSTQVLQQPIPDISTLTLAESLSIHNHPRPFKNPNPPYLANRTAANRRTKPVKMLLMAEREREEREAVEVARLKAAKQEQGDAMEVDDVQGDEEEDELDERLICYSTIEAPPSLVPQPKFCDITGLEAPYTDPSTGLRYHDMNIYAHIKSLKPSAVQSYLALRGQHATI